MAAIRRSFSGALQRRRSASMTPEQKTEETKLERLTERFERGMRNLKTLEARLITVSGAARNFKTALADLACGQLEDANGWPRGPTDVGASKRDQTSGRFPLTTAAMRSSRSGIVNTSRKRREAG